MPFTATEIEKRTAVLDKKARDAEEERQRQEAEEAEAEKLHELVTKEFGDISKYDLNGIALCALMLTNQLIVQFTRGEKTLSANSLIWTQVLSGSKVILQGRWQHDPKERERRMEILSFVAKRYRDIGQEFTTELAPNHTLSIREKSSSPKARVTCTAPLPVVS